MAASHESRSIPPPCDSDRSSSTNSPAPAAPAEPAEPRPVCDLTPAERLNFLLTNRIPRRWATLLVGRLSRIESRTLTRFGIAIWQAFGGDLNLHEAAEPSFRSLQHCFTRRLKPHLRPIDPSARILTSPCDAIVGQFGGIDGDRAYQAKGYPYSLGELLGDERLVELFRDGHFVTLRLRSNFYHRFHAPAGSPDTSDRETTESHPAISPARDARAVRRIPCS